MSTVPVLVFNNGHSCPVIGFGTWLPEPVTKVVKTALDVGYRHFDCAAAYENESKVGAAIADKIKEGLIKRVHHPKHPFNDEY